jgi:deazaflavin-dependent oxidoreductase (nitroreductase family)
MPRRLADLNTKRGLTRWALRLPIWLYRARLGWIFGKRFLMLLHTGRKTGLLRRTMLEVARYDRASRAFIVASGWGERSDWLLNIRQHPFVTIVVGNRRIEAKAIPLSIEEGEGELRDYARRHPRAFSHLAKWITGRKSNGAEMDFNSLARQIPLVAFRPRE